MTLTKNNILWLILILYAMAAILTILFFNGTGDEGDSIQHYLIARYAPLHPELFFDHWGKPVFTLLAFPFAQLGFTGIKVFNVIVVGLTIFLTCKSASLLQIRHSWMAGFILVFLPTYYILTFSGLTEPLFALFFILGIWLCLKEKLLPAAIVISFLPFVRSEGWVILLVFTTYFLYTKRWKSLPFLLLGHIVYSLAGYFVYHDLLWIFNQNPYNTLHSKYGSGGIFHFVFAFYNVTGVPIFFLTSAGLLVMLWDLFKQKFNPEKYILVLGGFASYILAHSLFWYFGIFNSMGLSRVLLGVFPAAAIIALLGYNFFRDQIPITIVRTVLTWLFTAYIVIFPFTDNPAAIDWKKNMQLSENQIVAVQVGEYVKKNVIEPGRYFFEHPYLNVTLHVDPFIVEKRMHLTKEGLQWMKKGDIIVWDHWFAPEERGVTQQYLDTLQGLTLLQSFPSVKNPGTTEFAIYQVR